MNPLPEIHPGTPTSMRASVELIVLRETAKALYVEHEACGPRFWLARSQVTSHRTGRMVDREVPGADQVRFYVHSFSIPVWLYQQKQKEAQPCPATLEH